MVDTSPGPDANAVYSAMVFWFLFSIPENWERHVPMSGTILTTEILSGRDLLDQESDFVPVCQTISLLKADFFNEISKAETGRSCENAVIFSKKAANNDQMMHTNDLF